MSSAPDFPAFKTFFMHVPKTAGHSISSAVGWAYPEARRLPAIGRGFGARTISKYDALAIPYSQFTNATDYSTGHLFFEEIDPWSSGAIFQDYCVFTVIREPLERAISAYAYIIERYSSDILDGWLPHGQTLDGKRVAEMGSLGTFLRSKPFQSGIVISQCRAVSGSETFDDARQSLKDRFVAFPTIEYLDSFYHAYHVHLGGPKASVGWINKSDGPSLIDELDAGSVAAFYAECHDEVQLYHWAKRHWRDHMETALTTRRPEAA